MNKAIILSGISGSGKSTQADLLSQTVSGKCVIVSADDYFYGSGEVYKFDPSKLGDAHGDCFKRYIHAMQEGVELVVVDNTNTTVQEISPYVLGAQAFGYDPTVVTVWAEWKDLGVLARRNTHGVNMGSLMTQYNRLEQRQLPGYWKQMIIPVNL
jgi:predicted ABC-type ATPase